MTDPLSFCTAPLRRALLALNVLLLLPGGISLLGIALTVLSRYHRTGYGPVAHAWALYAIGVTGAVMLYSAVSSTCVSRRRAGARDDAAATLGPTPSFVVSLLCQAGLAVGYVLVSGSEDLASSDPSGVLVEVETFVETHRALVLAFTLVLFVVESLAIGVSVYEGVLVRRAMEEADAAEAAALEAVAMRSYEPVSASAWNERLALKYGLDVRDMGGTSRSIGLGDRNDDEELGRPLLDDGDE